MHVVLVDVRLLRIIRNICFLRRFRSGYLFNRFYNAAKTKSTPRKTDLLRGM